MRKLNPKRIYHRNGQLLSEAWRVEGKFHRLDGPAWKEWGENGQLEYEEWLVDGKRHRVDGPAWQVWYETSQLWQKGWCVDGMPHRVDGPAYQQWHEDGKLKVEVWWIEGIPVEPVSDPLEWALFIAKTFGNTHGLEKFCLDNLEEKVARAIFASAKIM